MDYLGDYNTTETVDIPFNTFSSNDPSASVTVTNLAAADIKIHKDGGTTQRSSASGVTVSIDFDTITGQHIVHIDLSDNTDAGFYAAGLRYQVRLEGITVDGATLNAWIGTFSIGCVLRSAVAGRTLNIESSGALEGLVLQATTIATLTSQVSFTLADGSADDIAYDGATIIIIDATTQVQKAFGSLSGYTGASKTVLLAQDPGIFTMAVGDKVYIVPSDVFAIHDRALTGSTHNVENSHARRLRNLQEFGTYEGGAVFIDTVDGVAGTTDYESATNLHPVDSIADANTIATSLKLKRFNNLPGSSYTFGASQDNQDFFGNSWTLALGGQSISASHIQGAHVSGICTGASKPEFHECFMQAVTVPPCIFKFSDIEGVVTLPVGSVHFHHCAGESGGSLDYGAVVANTTVDWTDFSGELVISNLGANGVDVLNIKGHGKITLDSTCVGGTVNWDGHFTITDNSTTSPTLNGDDISTNVDSLIAAVTPATSLIGMPSTLPEYIYFGKQLARNKLKYNKSTDNMELYEDDGSTVKISFAMVDDASEATRGAGT